MPFWVFAFEASRPPEQLLRILSGNTGRGTTGLSFSGYVRGNYFFVTRTLEYRNPGNPLLIGRITGSDDVSHVRVLLTLQPGLWLILALVTWWLLIAHPLALGVAWLILGGGFLVEVPRSQRDLRWAMGLDDAAIPAA